MKASIVNCSTISAFYQSLVPALSNHSADVVVGDVSALTWIYPWHLTTAAALKELVRRSGKTFHISNCGGDDAQSYAERMGLYDGTYASNGAAFVYQHSRNQSSRFFELQLVSSDQNEVVFTELQKVLKNFPTAVPDVFSAFTEIADNMHYHSGTVEDSGWGFAHAQVINDRLHLAFCDLGVGYYETYNRNGLVNGRSSMQIIEDSLDLQKSCRNITNQNRGIGLHTVCDFVDSYRGSLEIYSDGVHCKYAGKVKVSRQLGFDTRGALICVIVPF